MNTATRTVSTNDYNLLVTIRAEIARAGKVEVDLCEMDDVNEIVRNLRDSLFAVKIADGLMTVTSVMGAAYDTVTGGCMPG